jgi:hypothetical protein
MASESIFDVLVQFEFAKMGLLLTAKNSEIKLDHKIRTIPENCCE